MQLASANLKIINWRESFFGFTFDVVDDNKEQIKACHSAFTPNDSRGKPERGENKIVKI